MPGPAYRDWLRAIGAPEDPVATDTSSEWSLISLFKAIYGQVSGGGLQAGLVAALAATSSTSVAIATGNQTFTIQSGKSFAAGQWVNVASAANPDTHYMNGPVFSYSGTTLIVAVDNTAGSGSRGDWVISLSGTQGAAGATGATGATGAAGEVASTGASTTNNLAKFLDTSGDVIGDAGVATSTDGTFAANSDAKLPTEKAVKTYADGLITALRDGVAAAYDTLAEIATAIATLVVGPASVTDGRFALFDGTTGKLIKEHTGAPGALAVLSTVGTSQIDDDAVSNAKLANMAASTIKGNSTAGSANPTDLTVANVQGMLHYARQAFFLTAVDFNSANTDNAITITLPTGYTRYLVAATRIAGASASISTATFGLFTSTGGGGTAIIAGGTAITVTSATAGSANSAQTTSPGAANTVFYTEATLYFRIGTAQGSAATAQVMLEIVAMP